MSYSSLSVTVYWCLHYSVTVNLCKKQDIKDVILVFGHTD